MEPCQILMMAQRLSTFSRLLENIGLQLAYFAYCAYFVFLCFFHQALFARVTTSIWVLVLFHDTSWHCIFSAEDLAQIDPQNRR
jgi:hypothetical protein